MDEILYCLCNHCVGIMYGWSPFPATAIAKSLGVSVHKVRYHLRKLKEKGLVESFHEGGITEEGDVFCYWGWTITKKAYSTEEYKKAYEKEREICKECFDIDIGDINQEDEFEKNLWLAKLDYEDLTDKQKGKI